MMKDTPLPLLRILAPINEATEATSRASSQDLSPTDELGVGVKNHAKDRSVRVDPKILTRKPIEHAAQITSGIVF